MVMVGTTTGNLWRNNAQEGDLEDLHQGYSNFRYSVWTAIQSEKIPILSVN